MKKPIQSIINQFEQKLKFKFISKFAFVGIVNSFAGYIIGIATFKLLYLSYGVVIVGFVSNILAILFSFINYKIFVFKTPFKLFFKEMSKSFILYGFIFIINIVLLFVCIELLKFNIYISQLLVISSSILFSLLGQFFFVFKKN